VFKERKEEENKVRKINKIREKLLWKNK